MQKIEWNRLTPHTLGMQASLEFSCGYCGRDVSSVIGDEASVPQAGGHAAWLRVCPNCGRPTLIDDLEHRQTPGTVYGDAVTNLPAAVAALYQETRVSAGSGAHNAAVLLARKLLMHIAVEKGAARDGNFLSFVDFLVDAGHVPPSAREWVDEIRKVGNQANHRIDQVAPAEAETMVDFVSMLLKLTYEYPARARRAIDASE